MSNEKKALTERILWIVYASLVLLLGIALIVASFSVLVYARMDFPSAENSSIGIIGGASGAISKYTLKRINYTYGQFMRFGALIAITGIFALVFNRFFSKRCGVLCAAVSMSISAVVGLGLSCVMWFATCYFLDHPKNHPIMHPASFIFGVICFVVFLCLIGLYIFLRFRKPSVKGILCDFGVSILYVAPFWAFFSNAYTPISEFIKNAFGL